MAAARLVIVQRIVCRIPDPTHATERENPDKTDQEAPVWVRAWYEINVHPTATETTHDLRLAHVVQIPKELQWSYHLRCIEVTPAAVSTI